ncbi:MAG: septation protein IspZ [Gammaproteobacteria bacterium]
MRLLYDFFPLLAFFIAYKFYGIFPATAVIIVATMIQIAVHWVRKHRVSPVHLGTAALILVFGGVTLLLGDLLARKCLIARNGIKKNRTFNTFTSVNE